MAAAAMVQPLPIDPEYWKKLRRRHRGSRQERLPISSGLPNGSGVDGHNPFPDIYLAVETEMALA
jgi:hypothetical protein